MYRDKGSMIKEIQEGEKRLVEMEKDADREERKLLDYDLKELYSKKIILEKKKELEERRKSIAEQTGELKKKKLMEEQRGLSVASAEKFYKRLRGVLERPTYALKQTLYGMLIEKIVVSREKAEVWLNIPTGDSPSFPVPSLAAVHGGGESICTGRVPYKKRHAPRRQPL